MAATNTITQARLKELLHYDPETGGFTWLVDKARAKKGNIAGYLSLGYIRIRLDGVKYQAHRLIFLYMLGWMPEQVDHDNHIRHDNRWINLNASSDPEKRKNMPLQCNNTSGHVGVVYNKQAGKWQSQMKLDGKYIFLGYFVDKADAIAARKAAEIKYGFHENHGKLLCDTC